MPYLNRNVSFSERSPVLSRVRPNLDLGWVTVGAFCYLLVQQLQIMLETLTPVLATGHCVHTFI